MLKIPGVDQFPKRLEETLPRKGACDPCEAATSAQDGTMIYQNGERLHTCMYIYIYLIYIYIFYIHSICACMCVCVIYYIYIYMINYIYYSIHTYVNVRVCIYIYTRFHVKNGFGMTTMIENHGV